MLVFLGESRKPVKHLIAISGAQKNRRFIRLSGFSAFPLCRVVIYAYLRSMKHRIVPYLFLVATLCMGCGGRISMRQLEQLEARVNDVPDSVLRVLTATDMPRWGEARALYALLTVQAQDKSFIDVADDSLICVATDYYATSSDARHRMLAFYYLSRVQYNMQAYAQSIISASRAEEEAITVSDDYYLGLIYRSMSENYNKTYNATEELRYIRMARDCFERAGYALHEQYARFNIAKAYMANSMYVESVQMCKALLNDSLAMQDTNLLSTVLSLYGKAATLVDDFSTAKEALLRLYEIPQYRWETSDYCYLARIYNNEQLADSASFYLDKAKRLIRTDVDSVFIYRALYEMAQAKEDSETALSNYQKIITLNDSATKAVLQQSVATTHRDYYKTRLEVEELRSQQQRYLIIVAAVVVLLVAVVLGIYVRSRFRHKQEELNEYMELYTQMEQERESLTELLQQNKELEQTAKVALQERVALLNRFFIANITDNLEMDHKVRQEIESLLANKEEFIISTRMAFAASHPQFIKYLEERGLTESELGYLCLYAIGLRGKEIGEYIQLKRHYHISSDIRKKLGIDEHETNLGIYIRKLMQNL